MGRKKKRKLKQEKTFTGIVDHVKRRYCFVSSDEITDDIKIKSRDMKNAINGDKVLFKLLNNYNYKGFEGAIIKIIERSHGVIKNLLTEIEIFIKNQPKMLQAQESIFFGKNISLSIFPLLNVIPSKAGSLDIRFFFDKSSIISHSNLGLFFNKFMPSWCILSTIAIFAITNLINLDECT